MGGIMTEFVLVLSTTQVGDADWIARSLVEERLAACVNISQVKSHFIWEGKLSEEQEAMMIIKTESRLVDRLKSRIKELHSYQLPEIIVVPIVGGDEVYLHWIRESID
ncbi:MAG: divalent-cation tolerance protein CutA [Methanotrichaceae archaeon]|nr:divalent-cation tolerance protein CutA [Methanotrichaceae archaeon]